MDVGQFIKAQESKKKRKNRRASNREEYIATTTFAASKALHYGIINVRDLATLRKKCYIYSKDFVVHSIYLVRWNGNLYRILNKTGERLPLLISTDEYLRRTGRSAYEKTIRVKSCR